jgi:dihydroorotate dehydrogenase (fumarate)
MELRSSYAGIQLDSPIVVGASPLALDVERVQKLAANGAGAIVMPSMFEEQITEAQHLGPNGQSLASSDPTGNSLPRSGPDLDNYNGGTEGYLHSIEKLKAVVDIPVFASISCATTGDWMDYAAQIRDAGADAIELSAYHYEMDPHRFADEIERELIDRIGQFCSRSPLPVAVKVLPQFTCLANVAYRIAGAGAKSICLFGQFPALESRASGHIEFRWRITSQADFRGTAAGIAQVRGAAHNLTFAASGGIHDPMDAVAALQLGAEVVMVTSAIYRHGGTFIRQIHNEIVSTMSEHNWIELSELVGSRHSGFDPFPEATRRGEFSSSIAAFPSAPKIREDNE